MRPALALLCLLLSSCGRWSRETIAEETAYQTLGAVDAYQTIHRGRCAEADGTWLHAVAGPQPKTGAIIALDLARGTVHAYVTGVMEAAEVDRWYRRLWQGLNIAVEAKAVSVNWHIPCAR